METKEGQEQKPILDPGPPVTDVDRRLQLIVLELRVIKSKVSTIAGIMIAFLVLTFCALRC
jgi:hypothetical protein